jgi:lactate permease
LAFALATLAAVVGIGYLSNYSGMSYTLGLACASYAGKLFPLFSPVVGWLGVFLAGSVTSSSALFGKLQQVRATQTGVNPVGKPVRWRRGQTDLAPIDCHRLRVNRSGW